jgi:nucleolin
MDSLNDAQEGQNGETTNLFVGRLSWATDDDALYQEFSSFGEITGCRVVYDRDSGRSKGYVTAHLSSLPRSNAYRLRFGYVEFAKLSDAINAKEAKHEALFDGRNINVDYSQPRTGKPREAAPDRAKRFGDVRGAPAETIFIGNLSFDATYDIIKETFAEYGEITRISLPTDRESGQMKGFGYVSFTSVDEAKAALDSLSGVEIAGRRVRLDFATSRPGGDGGGGQSRGGGFGGGQGRGGGFGRGRGGDGWRGNSRGGRGRGGGGGGGFGARGHSTNRGGFGDYAGRKMTF